MSEEDRKAADDRRHLDAEMVPLTVAARVAYFHLAEAARQPHGDEALSQVTGLVAIALAAVAPIYRGDALLSAQELEDQLYRPAEHGGAPDLGPLQIRRGDLRAAMVTLREARAQFSPPR